MAGNKLKGIIKINPIKVTSNELRMKGKKPNFPDDGCQAEENNNSVIDSMSKMGEAFMTSPNTISKGRRSTIKTHSHVQAPAEYSFIFRMATMLIKFSKLCFNSRFRQTDVACLCHILLAFR